MFYRIKILPCFPEILRPPPRLQWSGQQELARSDEGMESWDKKRGVPIGNDREPSLQYASPGLYCSQESSASQGLDNGIALATILLLHRSVDDRL